MAATHSKFLTLIRAITSGDATGAAGLLAASPELAAARAEGDIFFEDITHYLYAGDAALHIAAAAYEHNIARRLIALGANVDVRNRRGATPLHYAADGAPGSPSWNPRAQAATIALLIKAGADPNAIDKSAVTPLHRAARTRCAAAGRALVDGGADPRSRNKNGSTPLDLATRNTGRGGSGSVEAKTQQAEIIRIFERYPSA